MSPGEGPPTWMINGGGFTVEGVAVRFRDNMRKKVIIEGVGDPSFGATPKLTMELAIGLALQGLPKHRRGFLTPALAMQTTELEKRLANIDSGNFMNITYVNMGTYKRN